MLHPARRLGVALAVLPLLAAPAVLSGPDPAQALSVSALDAAWETPTELPANAEVVLLVGVHGEAGPSVNLLVDLVGVRIDAIPDGCAASDTIIGRSSISATGEHLTCQLRRTTPDQQVRVSGVVTAAAGGTVTGSVRSEASVTTLAPRRVVAGPAPDQRRLRLVSSPDFLNADVADLRHGPNRWTKGHSANSVNRHYDDSIAGVLADWGSLAPDGVLVAGDLVEGRWDEDTHRTGTFGPVRTQAQKRAAIRRAAHTIYPQYVRRFTDRGLHLYPAIGDHEIGDNPWPRGKRGLVATYKEQYAHFLTQRRGRAVYADRPRRSRARLTAYAVRPVPQVQLVTLDVFDVTPGHARLGLDKPQLRWLERVLAKAQADGVPWTIVQAHTPVLEPVRARGSSQLHVQRGARSKLWKVFARYGVDLYLDGEVHAVTMSNAAGVTQLAHGGAFAYGLTNYAVLDFYDDHLAIDLRDYDVAVRRQGRRLWETRGPGIPRVVDVDPTPFTIGTATITPDGALVRRNGILLPYDR